MRKSFKTFRERLTATLILMSMSFAPVFAFVTQDIVVKGKGISAKEAIQLIQENSGYTFFYKKSDLERIPRRTLIVSVILKKY